MSKHIDVAGQLPEHFQSMYPRFIRFLELYYEWLYRNGGYTKEQIDALKSDPDAIRTNVDKFIKEGQLRDYSSSNPDYNLPAVVEIATQPAAGTEAENIAGQYLLERQFDFFESADGDVFETSDGVLLDSPVRNDIILESWYKKLGFSYVPQATDLETSDRMLMVRLLKHIHNIKGSHQSMKIFFRMFFKEDVEIYLPKFDLCVIDDNFVPDSLRVIRDDDFYQEFSYVIYVDGDPADYKDLFENVYLKFVHPSGFKAFLVQKPVD